MDRRLPSLVAPPFRGFVVGAVVIAGFAMASCGREDRSTAPGQTVSSSMEPIDAVPLPLDGNGLTPTPAPEPEPASKAEDKTEARLAEAPSDAAAEIAADTAVPAPNIVVAPRASATTPPATSAPARPAEPPPPTAEPERPVLNF